MLGFLLAGGFSGVEDSLEESAPAVTAVTKVATPTATVVYDGLVKQAGIQWGTVIHYILYVVGAVVLGYLLYRVVKALSRSKK